MIYFKKLLQKIINFLFPLQCFVCSKLSDLNVVCNNCEYKLTKINNKNICRICGYPDDNFIDMKSFFEKDQKDKKISICEYCSNRLPMFWRARSVFVYENISRKMILNMKFMNNFANLNFMAQQMFDLYQKEKWNCDAIAFVPSHWSRYFFKGYNHAMLLAKYFYKIAKNYEKNIEYLPNLLIKYKKTTMQKKLNQHDRLYKQHHIVYNSKYLKKFNKILLIDDVITTGSTITSCSREIKKYNPKSKIFCLSFARTILN